MPNVIKTKNDLGWMVQRMKYRGATIDKYDDGSITITIPKSKGNPKVKKDGWRYFKTHKKWEVGINSGGFTAAKKLVDRFYDGASRKPTTKKPKTTARKISKKPASPWDKEYWF